MGCNTLIEWMGIVDSSGTNVACYAPMYTDGVMNPLSTLVGFVISTIVQIGIFVTGLMILLVRLITDPDLLLNYIGGGLQNVLDAIHRVIPPVVLAALGFGIAVFRSTAPAAAEGDGFLGWLVPKSARERVSGNLPQFARINGFNYKKYNDPVRVFTRAITQGIVVFGTIYVLSLNPITLLAKAISAVASLGSSISQGAGEGTKYATNIVENLVYLVNFPAGNVDCIDTWKQAMQTGDKSTLETCTEVPDAGVQALLTSLLFIVVLGALAYYLWRLFQRGSLFLLITVWDFVTLPYKLGWEMFKPNFTAANDRKWYDELMETIFEFFIYLIYFLVIVFLLTSGPAAVLMLFADSNLHAMLQYLGISALLFAIGYNAERIGPGAQLRQNKPDSWSEMFSSKTIERSIFHGVYTRDDLTGQGSINWHRLAENVKTSTAGQDVRALFNKDGIEGKDQALQAITAKDQEKRTAMEQIINSAFGQEKEDTPTAIQERMYHNPEQFLNNLDNQRATVRRKMRDGKISKDEAVRRLSGLDEREEALRQMIRLKEEAEDKKLVDKDSGKLVAIPLDLKDVKKFKNREFATEREIEYERELKNMNTIAGYLDRGVTGEQLMTWDQAEKDLVKTSQAIEDLDEARSGMSVEYYTAERDRLVSKKTQLQKIADAKAAFEASNLAVEDIVLDGKNYVTRDQKARRDQVRNIASALDISESDAMKWLNKDQELQKIQDEKNELQFKFQNGAYQTDAEVKKYKEALAAKDKEKENLELVAKKIEGFERLQSERGTEEFAHRRAGEKLREFAAESAFGPGVGGVSGVEQLRVKEQEVDAARKALSDARSEGKDPAVVDKALRALRKVEQDRDVQRRKVDEFNRIMDEEKWVFAKNPLHDPNDKFSEPYLYFMPGVGEDGSTPAEMIVRNEAQKAGLSVQNSFHQVLSPLVDNVHGLVDILRNKDAENTDITHGVEASYMAANSIVDQIKQSPGSEEQVRELQQAISDYEQATNKTLSSQDPDEVKSMLLQSATALKTSTDSVLSTVSMSHARQAAEDAARSAVEDLREKNIEVSMPSVLEVSQLDSSTLSNLSAKYLDDYTDKIKATVTQEALEDIRSAAGDQMLLEVLRSEPHQIAVDVYDAADSTDSGVSPQFRTDGSFDDIEEESGSGKEYSWNNSPLPVQGSRYASSVSSPRVNWDVLSRAKGMLRISDDRDASRGDSLPMARISRALPASSKPNKEQSLVHVLSTPGSNRVVVTSSTRRVTDPI